MKDNAIPKIKKRDMEFKHKQMEIYTGEIGQKMLKMVEEIINLRMEIIIAVNGRVM